MESACFSISEVSDSDRISYYDGVNPWTDIVKIDFTADSYSIQIIDETLYKHLVGKSLVWYVDLKLPKA